MVETLSAIGSQTDEMDAAAAKQKKADIEAALESRWGRQYDQNMALSRRALKEFADDDTLAYLEESGLGNDPRMLDVFLKIGQGMMEDGKLEGIGEAAVTPAQAQAKINEIMSHPDYLNAKSPNRMNLVRQLNDLYEVVYGTEPANKNLLASV